MRHCQIQSLVSCLPPLQGSVALLTSGSARFNFINSIPLLEAFFATAHSLPHRRIYLLDRIDARIQKAVAKDETGLEVYLRKVERNIIK